MQHGDQCFDIHGQEYTFVAEVPKEGFLVRAVLYDDYGGVFEDTAIFIDQVFANPPKERYDADTAKAREVLDDLNQQISAARKTLREAEEVNAKLLSKVQQQNAALTRIDRFLDGKITHYVVRHYSDLAIVPLAETACDSDRWQSKRALKLLTLFGKEDGNLEFRLNNYKDGSGGDVAVVPCESYEEALQILTDTIVRGVADWRDTSKTNYSPELCYLKKAADAYNIHFPQDAAEWLHNREVANAERCVAEREKSLEAAKTALALVKGGAA